jgi:hypothetical protein
VNATTVYHIDTPVVNLITLRGVDYAFTVTRTDTYSYEVKDQRVTIDIHGSEAFLNESLMGRARFLYRKAYRVAASLFFYMARMVKVTPPAAPAAIIPFKYEGRYYPAATPLEDARRDYQARYGYPSTINKIAYGQLWLGAA